MPATSAKVTTALSGATSLARDLPKENGPPEPPMFFIALRLIQIHTPMISTIGSSAQIRLARKDGRGGGTTVTSTLFLFRSVNVSALSGA